MLVPAFGLLSAVTLSGEYLNGIASRNFAKCAGVVTGGGRTLTGRALWTMRTHSIRRELLATSGLFTLNGSRHPADEEAQAPA